MVSLGIMAYTMNGTVEKILERQEFPSGFYKQEFVVRTQDDRFEQQIKFECLKEKVEILENLKEGDEVTVHFDIRGREWNEKYFVNLAAWKVESGSQGETAGNNGSARREEPAAMPAEDPAQYPGTDEVGDEDVPF